MLEAQIRAFGVPVNPCVARRSEAPVDTKTKSTPSMSSMRTSTPTIAAARGAVAAKKPHSMESQLPTHKAVPEGPITSHMFRNIPRKYTADDIASELQVVSPTSTFDFISLPWDTNKPANLGFAFVNFLDAAGAAMARAAMHGQLWKKARQGAKAIKVCTAHVQGLRENVLYCADHISPMLSVEHHPLVLFGGRRIDFGDAVRLFGGQSSPCPLELQPSQSQQQEQQQQQQLRQEQRQLQQPPVQLPKSLSGELALSPTNITARQRSHLEESANQVLFEEWKRWQEHHFAWIVSVLLGASGGFVAGAFGCLASHLSMRASRSAHRKRGTACVTDHKSLFCRP
mmetsp:Transcript_85505/g.275858  ORF Transcript_85505/g.275858 Transcript_85505/m.275858 type:complete len:342 (+) Transcript_85505:63-1088(+)